MEAKTRQDDRCDSDRYEELRRHSRGAQVSRSWVRSSTRCETFAPRARPSASQGVRDEAESSEAEIQDDIEFALLQMKAETLSKITEALSRGSKSLAPTATATSVATKSPSNGSAHCRSPSDARIARRPVRRSQRSRERVDEWTPRCWHRLFADMIS